MPFSTKGDEQALCSNMPLSARSWIGLQFHDWNYPCGWIFPVCPSLSYVFLLRLSMCNHILLSSAAANKPQVDGKLCNVAENLRSATSALIMHIPFWISLYNCCPCLLNSFETSLCLRNSCNSKLLTHHTHGPSNFANQGACLAQQTSPHIFWEQKKFLSTLAGICRPWLLPHQVSKQLSVSGDCRGAPMPSAFFTT